MRIVWFSWKDRSHPLAGGAETVSGEIMDRLVRDGHSVKLITAMHTGAKEHETVEGLEIIRLGNRFTVYAKARRYFTENLSDWPDLVIDEMNTIPFGSAFVSKQKNVLLAYQLAREIWFYQMFFPVSLVGYLAEPLYLRLLSKKYSTVLTESNSTKQDMQKYGFQAKNIQTFRVGMALKPLDKLSEKQNQRIVLSLGAMRPMKRTLHAVKAFESARDKDSSLRMVIAGDTSGKYAQNVLSYIASSRHTSAIEVKGRVSNDVRLELMQTASVILVTSVKEGWGLIITEANSQGTPAIAYNVDGLRDSVKDNETGLLVANNDFATMGKAIVELINNPSKYETLRQKAWQWSKEFTFENSYQDFMSHISGTTDKNVS